EEFGKVIDTNNVLAISANESESFFGFSMLVIPPGKGEENAWFVKAMLYVQKMLKNCLIALKISVFRILISAPKGNYSINSSLDEPGVLWRCSLGLEPGKEECQILDFDPVYNGKKAVNFILH